MGIQICNSQILNEPEELLDNAIVSLKEMAAYELLWKRHGSVKKMADLFAENPNQRPSDLVNETDLSPFFDFMNLYLENFFRDTNSNFLINSTFDYPTKLRDAKDPVELLYYQGNLELLRNHSIAVVGSRSCSEDGLRRTKKLVEMLVKDNFTIISGLANGIDTQAHKTAIHNDGRTIAVLGTPLNKYYPRENKSLQQEIAKNHLLISQVPFWHYTEESYFNNRLFFLERNKTMSALSEATVIVEASDTSGTLIQAKAALYQRRKLFILDNNFKNPKISWPYRLKNKGAIRVREYEDITRGLRKVNET